MNKSTLSFIIILICALFSGTGIYWYVYINQTPRTRYAPLIGNNPPPNNLPPPAVVSSFIPVPAYSPPSEPPDTRSWGERFRDKTIPHISGIEWETYTNKEYGFGIEYPKGWRFAKGERYRYPHVLDSFRLYLPEEHKHSDFSIFSLEILSETLRELARNDSSLNERLKHNGIIPDTTINGIDLFVLIPDAKSDESVLWAVFEKDGHAYYLSHSFEAHNEQNNKIIEHMVKTLHIVK